MSFFSQLPPMLLLVVGGALLYFGAEWLVRGSSGLAVKLRIKPIVIGLTVVAYGTSAPELVVGVGAALSGKGGIAFGNAIGSNIANLGLILGSAAIASAKPLKVDGSFRRREVPALLLSAIIPPALMLDGRITRLEGLLLVLLAIVYTHLMLRHASSSLPSTSALSSSSSSSLLEETAAARAEKVAAEVASDAAVAAGAKPPKPGTLAAPPTATSTWKLAIFAAAGLIALLAGGKWLVDGAVRVSTLLGLSERLVGLTIVSVGTSLPELATSLIAARRGHGEIAVGNVIGSNIFNAFLILGASGLAGPLDVSLRESGLELGVLAAMTLIAAVLLRKERHLTRREGAMLIALYVAFLIATVRRA